MSNFSLPPLGPEGLSGPRLPMQGFGGPPSRVQDPERTGPAAAPEAGGPTSVFGGVLDELKALRDDVTQKTRGLALGEDVELHDVMMATSKSEVAFNLMLEVRNKLVDAWEKLSRSAV
jgi:flagellar hook-basal body complex protein FliE